MPSKRRNQKKVVERPKNRKELRKDKRLQKKANRVHYHKKKKELKIEYRERIKNQKNDKKNNKNQAGSDGFDHPEMDNDDEYNEDLMEQQDEYDEDVALSNAGDDNDDEEIESDFELSDEEMESKFKSKSSASKLKKKPNIVIEPDRIQQDLQREKQKQKQLEREMRKQRVHQLKAANEDDDKMIRKLEKQLKIDKKRSDKRVPKMFNDGLEYALELCLPENIEKMYAAAKEAADQENDSDGEFQEDLAAAVGGAGGGTPKNNQNKKNKQQLDKINNDKGVGGVKINEKKLNKQSNIVDKKIAKRMATLRQAESKYFDTDDELDSDLSGNDSEFDDGDDDGCGSGEDNSDDEVKEMPIEKSYKKNKISSNINFDMDDDDEEEDSQDEDEESLNEMDDDDDDSGSDDKNDDHIFDEDDIVGDDEQFDTDDSDNNDTNSKKKQKSDVWEDIYGRTRDKDGNVITNKNEEKSVKEESTGKYVPPHLRARLSDNAAAVAVGKSIDDDPKRREKLSRLKKQLKGHMNRLSEANIHKISVEIDKIYMANSRHDVNHTLIDLILDALVSNVLSPERMVLEHMMLVAALHANIGSEVGAQFLQTFIEKFDGMVKKMNDYDVENKELDNIIFVICHMYTFKIFQHNLIYEIVSKLSETLTEKSVECILLILRSVGFSLRKDDPIALKELINLLQQKTNESTDDMKNNSRLKYMLDVLLAIKNNNVNKIPQYDPTLGEHLRKILRTLLVNGKYVVTLNITLEDLLRVDERGKWWVVGSAWTGNVSDIGSSGVGGSSSTEFEKINNKLHTEATKFSATILKLAKQQRMNTDDRKNVFCILMTANDYLDAFEKLHHLAIKDHKVIITVIIHCCLSENLFNPYYAVLAQKFCDFDRKYQLAIQFATWDRIKDIKTHSSVQLKNLAQFLIYLIENSGLALSVLKIIEFGELDKCTLRLVRQIMLGLLMGTEAVCKQVFGRIAPSGKLKGFKDSIRLFMHHFLLKGGNKSGITAEQLKLLKQRVRIADQSLETIESKIQF